MKDETMTEKELAAKLQQLRRQVTELEKSDHERKQAEERVEHLNLVLSALRNVNQLITKEKDRGKLLQGICDNLTENRGYHGAWVALLDESGKAIAHAESGMGESFSPLVERLKRGELTYCTQRALKQSEAIVTEDPVSTCTDCPLSGSYVGRGAVTVRLEYGKKVYGLLSVSVPVAIATDIEELDLFRELTSDIALALHNLEMEEKRKLAEEEKAKLEQQLHQSQKLESIGRLAGGVAHDLNNMLTPILGFGQLLLDRPDGDEERREQLEEIMKAGRRARDLVQQLLAFSRKQSFEFKTIDLNALLKDFEKLLRSTIREDIAIKLITAKSLPFVQGDVGQLEQVVMNLAVNAQDAMPDGGELIIETSMVKLDKSYAAEHVGVTPGPHVMLAISDTGCGMDAEIREQIFEPFFTTKDKDKGTGLGLSTVYGIVKQHGGNIWVYSEPGKGTTFKVYLPVSGETKAEQQTEVKTSTISRGSETILLAEDDEFVRKLAHTVLKQSGYTVLTAKNGTDALQVLKSHDGQVHLLLTDVVMPEMNGKELFNRAVENHPNLKVLYMSGYTDNVIAHSGVLEKGVAFIQKPFNVNDLTAKVREMLD